MHRHYFTFNNQHYLICHKTLPSKQITDILQSLYFTTRAPRVV